MGIRLVMHSGIKAGKGVVVFATESASISATIDERQNVSLWKTHRKPPECAGCPHEKKGRSFVPGEGDIDTATIIAVFERPGRKEAEEGKPLVWKTGEIVRDSLGGWHGVYRTNVRKCFVEEECPPEEERAAAAHCAAAYLSYEFLRVARANRASVLLIGGAEAAAAFGGKIDMQKWHGATYTGNEFRAIIGATEEAGDAQTDSTPEDDDAA